ncbi:alpha/beta hydrolase [Candidatus Beckwithbacteria bacterium]|nr:alpha/beta hydrolase [Candidatus Beckwithbacteria bacterium]
MKNKQIIINNLLISYFEQNGFKKPVLVFLHGWRSNKENWLSLLKELKDYSTYVLDLPGFGASQTQGKTFSLDEYSKIVEQFIEKLKLQNVILVGHSFGGAIATKLVLKSKLISKLILIDSSGLRSKTAKKTVLKSVSKLAKPLFTLPFMKPLRTQIYEKLGWDDYLATPKLRQSYLAIIKEDLKPMLQLIKQPTLLIWGENDQDTPTTDANIFRKSISKSDLKIVKDAGHYSFLDQPQVVAQFIQNFID